MKDEFQFVPPGWEDIFDASDEAGAAAPGSSVYGSEESAVDDSWLLLVMVEGRPDYSLIFGSQDEAFQAQYELLSAIKDGGGSRSFGSGDDEAADAAGFVRVSSDRASISIRARSIIGTYVCRTRDVSQREP